MYLVLCRLLNLARGLVYHHKEERNKHDAKRDGEYHPEEHARAYRLAASGTRYTEPVLLQKEGEVEIRAIAVNKNGIPSVVSSAEYKIEFPIVNAPAVTPSTGQYTEPTQITITVPEGYTAYYTMDGSTPTTSSEKYEGPIDMPQESKTVFSAILVNDQNQKATAVTTRTYFWISE